jgi:hypothetical protein
MKWIKLHWKELLIALLFVLFVSKCTSSGNYKRKYNKQVAYTEYAIDSLKNMYGKSAKTIDSLTIKLNESDMIIHSQEKMLDMYKDQNAKLNDANNKLANKKIIVNIDKEKTNEQ